MTNHRARCHTSMVATSGRVIGTLRVRRPDPRAGPGPVGGRRRSVRADGGACSSPATPGSARPASSAGPARRRRRTWCCMTGACLPLSSTTVHPHAPRVLPCAGCPPSLGAADAERPAARGRLVPEPRRGAGPVAGRHLPRAPGRRGRRRPPVGRREHARRAHVRPRRAARPAAGGAPHAAPRRGGCRPHAAAMAGRHPQDAVVRRTAARALRPHRDARAARRHPRHAAPRVAPQ